MQLSIPVILFASSLIPYVAASNGSTSVRKRVSPAFAIQSEDSYDFGRFLKGNNDDGSIVDTLYMSMSISLSMSMGGDDFNGFYRVGDGLTVSPNTAMAENGIQLEPNKQFSDIQTQTDQSQTEDMHSMIVDASDQSSSSEDEQTVTQPDSAVTTTDSNAVSSLYERSCNAEASSTATGVQYTIEVPYSFEIEVHSAATDVDDKINTQILDTLAETLLDCFASSRHRGLSISGDTDVNVEKVAIVNENDSVCNAVSPSENECFVKGGYVTLTFTSTDTSNAEDRLFKVTTEIVKEDVIDVLASLPEVARTKYLDSSEIIVPLEAPGAKASDEENITSSPVIFILLGVFATAILSVISLIIYKRASSRREAIDKMEKEEKYDEETTQVSEDGEFTDVPLSPMRA